VIAREAKLAAAATAFLTRISAARWTRFSDEQLNHSSRYFSLVGAGVGAVGAAVLLATSQVLPVAVAVVLSVIATVILTGALHEDGLADTCDALGGGTTREDVFRILEDSRIGAYGTIGLILVLALKLAALAHLSIAIAAVALICAHAFSRAVCVGVMALGRYAKHEGGKTRPIASGVRVQDATIALGLALLPFAWAPTGFAWAIPAMLVVSLLAYVYMRSRIGGYTGDCLGAIQQLSEASCYVTILAIR
jgi:adenosylcobinamide-GDP ribazoletransferase